MEKSKHDYEVEIQNLKQQLMGAINENDEIKMALKEAYELIDKASKKHIRYSKVIEVLADKLIEGEK